MQYKNNLSKMKTLVFCACILACVSSIAARTVVEKLNSDGNHGKIYMNSCLNSVGLTYDEGFDVDDIINNIHQQPEMEEKTVKHGCLIECLLKKLEWMEGSELMEERIYGNVTQLLKDNPLQAKAQKLVRDCAKEVKDATQERCQKGLTAMVCVVKSLQKWDHRVFVEDEENEENEDD